MRHAIISDVHANESALRAVLTDAVDARADKVICLGDVLGYGPEPVAALELVYRCAHVCLAGNHDDAVSRRFPVEDFTDFAAAAIARHRAALSQEAIDWLRRLPYTCEFDGFACVHGDFSDPKHFNYILEPQDAQPSWKERPEQLLFVGHTHQPGIFVVGASGSPHLLAGVDFTLEDGKRYIVNPGSVGYPRSGACRSSYCIYDDQSRTVFFRTLPFDLDSYATKMHGQGLNEAPWMLARAAERRRPFVRGAANFGVAVEQRLAPPTGGSGVSPLQKPLLDEAARRRFPQWAVALIALGILALVAIVAYTLFILRSMPKDHASISDLPVQEVPPAPPPAQPLAENVFGPEQNLAEGWTVAVENPDEQNVVVEYNGKRNAQVFRIEHAAPHTVRFTKRLNLRSRPDRLYWKVELADGRRGGAVTNFQFSTHLTLSDENGALLDRVDGSGKRSAKKDCAVPEAAVDAVMAIDCLCVGTNDLVVPYFAGRPPLKKEKIR